MPSERGLWLQVRLFLYHPGRVRLLLRCRHYWDVRRGRQLLPLCPVRQLRGICSGWHCHWLLRDHQLLRQRRPHVAAAADAKPAAAFARPAAAFALPVAAAARAAYPAVCAPVAAAVSAASPASALAKPVTSSAQPATDGLRSQPGLQRLPNWRLC